MAAYPTFTSGVVVHRPWRYEREYKNVHNDMPHGFRYSYNLLATPLMRWIIEYTFSDVDLVTMQAFWDSQFGGWDNITFTDPETGTVYTKCRFDMDSLVIRHVGPNQNAVTVVIQEHA